MLFTWDQTVVEVMKIMATSFKRSHALTATLSAPNPAAGHHQPMPPPETPGQSQESLSQSLLGSLLLSPGSWCAQGSVCALQEFVSPVLCKFWQLCGGVNGDLLQEGLCHTQVCGTQSPYPCSRPPCARVCMCVCVCMCINDTLQETGVKTIRTEKKCKKAKWLSGEDL